MPKRCCVFRFPIHLLLSTFRARKMLVAYKTQVYASFPYIPYITCVSTLPHALGANVPFHVQHTVCLFNRNRDTNKCALEMHTETHTILARYTLIKTHAPFGRPHKSGISAVRVWRQLHTETHTILDSILYSTHMHHFDCVQKVRMHPWTFPRGPTVWIFDPKQRNSEPAGKNRFILLLYQTVSFLSTKPDFGCFEKNRKHVV